MDQSLLNRNPSNSRRRFMAQTATELIVFGSVLMFVIGVIFKQAASLGFYQTITLQAMRLAMIQSFKYSEGLESGSCSSEGGSECGWGVSSRNVASVIIVQDRLTADSAKYGSIDRMPLVALGTGSFSRNLLLPMDKNENWNIPVVDLFLNGKHFPLAAGRLKNIDNLEDPAHPDWDPECAKDGSSTIGCRRFYRKVSNHPAIEEWCDHDGGSPVRECTSQNNLIADERFDLDRDGVMDVTDSLERENFAWQWYLVMAFRKQYLDADLEEHSPSYELIKGDGIILHEKNRENVILDVDGDLKEELLIGFWDVASSGQIRYIQILDQQEGDLDMTVTQTEIDEGVPQPGLTSDIELYAFSFGETDDPGVGTYLLVDEGNLYTTDDRRFIRHVQKKDTIDIITRVINLSNDTGRFCSNVRAPGEPQPEVDGLPNPVEVCCSRSGCVDGITEDNDRVSGENCGDAFNNKKTCMFEGDFSDLDNIIYPRIYVRSRVKDLQGRKWITDISGDQYVDFQVPGIP